MFCEWSAAKAGCDRHLPLQSIVTLEGIFGRLAADTAGPPVWSPVGIYGLLSKVMLVLKPSDGPAYGVVE